tara:strand:- start:635 stop:1243 length:609 start_codon:yes stop_codon:yes gene_type:complete
MNWEHTLTEEELVSAIKQAIFEQSEAYYRFGDNKDDYHDHGGHSGRNLEERLANTISGKLAEYAAASLVGVPVSEGEAGVISHGDLGGFIEIKASVYSSGHLVIPPKDPSPAPYILMIGPRLGENRYPKYRAAGWIGWRKEKASERWWRTPPKSKPAGWWIPQSDLRPMEEFVERRDAIRNYLLNPDTVAEPQPTHTDIRLD